MSFQAASSFGGRDVRRRRLLTDELSNSTDWPTRQISPEGDSLPPKSENYGDAAFLEQQPRLLDLAPRGPAALALLALAAVAIVVGLEFAYGWMLRRVAQGGSPVAALDLAAKGSLGGWFSSLMLLAASVAACLIYSVRRHRVDDYQGRYRVWLWAAGCWFVMAGDQAASLREAFRELMIGLTGTRLVGDGSLWWAALDVLVLGAVGSRVLLDMRPSRLSIAALAAAATAHAVAMAVRLDWISLPEGPGGPMFLAGTEMAGNLLLLAAMAVYARHVILDAEGLLPRREPKSAEEPTTQPSTEPVNPATLPGKTWVKVNPPHTSPQPTFQRAGVPQTATPVAFASPQSAQVAATVNRKLTKAERKALKDRLLHARLERERGGL